MFLMNISVLFQTQADFPYFYHFIYSGKIGSLEEFCFSFCLCSIFHTKNNLRLPRCSSLHLCLNSNWHSDVLRGMNSKIVLKLEAFKFLKNHVRKTPKRSVNFYWKTFLEEFLQMQIFSFSFLLLQLGHIIIKLTIMSSPRVEWVKKKKKNGLQIRI